MPKQLLPIGPAPTPPQSSRSCPPGRLYCMSAYPGGSPSPSAGFDEQEAGLELDRLDEILEQLMARFEKCGGDVEAPVGE